LLRARREFGVAPARQLWKLTDIPLRPHSSREKNTGSYAYAFNSFQRAFFPAELRAPFATLGKAKDS
jgi:hypothetical protein